MIETGSDTEKLGSHFKPTTMTISEAIFSIYYLREMPGQENNPEILALFKDIGHEWVKTDETHWCAATINATLKRAGFPYMRTLSAKSFLSIGERIAVPKPLGSSNEFVDIVLFYRGKPWTDYDPEHFEPGHVGFYINHRAGLIHCLSGNQSNMIKISGYYADEFAQYRRIYKP